MIEHAQEGCAGTWRRTRGRYAERPALFCGTCLAVAPATDATLAAASDANRRRILSGAAGSPGRDA